MAQNNAKNVAETLREDNLFSGDIEVWGSSGNRVSVSKGIDQKDVSALHQWGYYLKYGHDQTSRLIFGRD